MWKFELNDQNGSIRITTSYTDNSVKMLIEDNGAGISKDIIQKITRLLGLPMRDLLRTTEQVYKDAGLDDPDLTDEDILEALAECPSLLQRPIVIVDDSKAAIGRPPESVLEIL